MYWGDPSAGLIVRRVARKNEILQSDRIILRSGNINHLEAFAFVLFFNAELLWLHTEMYRLARLHLSDHVYTLWFQWKLFMICIFGLFISAFSFVSSFYCGVIKLSRTPLTTFPPNLGNSMRGVCVCLCVHKGVQRTWAPPPGCCLQFYFLFRAVLWVMLPFCIENNLKPKNYIIYFSGIKKL